MDLLKEPFTEPKKNDTFLIIGAVFLSVSIMALAAVGAYTVYGWITGL